MRCLVLLLSIFALAASYYMPRAVYNFSPYRYEPYGGPRPMQFTEEGRSVDTVRKHDKKASDFLAVKRFKPCYYSPIQCLIKKRK